MTRGDLVLGSLQALATQSGKSLAETFVNAEVIIIVDTSGSMNTHDSREGKSRYEVAVTELNALQMQNPGKIAVIVFSSTVQFCPSGVAAYLGGSTALAKALEFVKIADVSGMKFILISDGEPDDPDAARRVAETFKNKIDVIYVGPEERATGRDFLYRLARATGGSGTTVDRAKELGSGLQKLLGMGGR